MPRFDNIRCLIIAVLMIMIVVPPLLQSLPGQAIQEQFMQALYGNNYVATRRFVPKQETTTATRLRSPKAQAMLLDGIHQLSLTKVAQALSDGADPNQAEKGLGCPLFMLASIRESSKFEAVNAISSKLLTRTEIDPNGDGSSWSPLKTAVASRNIELVKMLLGHHFTIPEVEVSGLDCGATTLELPSSLKFYISSKSARVPKCFLDLPKSRTVTAENSRLAKKHIKEKTDEKKNLNKLEEELDAIVAGKKKVQLDPRNAFITLPTDMYPSRAETVMNPTPFRNIYTAALFYFFGPPPSLTVGIVLLALLGACITLATLTILKVAQLGRNRAQLEREVEEHRLERELAAKVAIKAAVEKEDEERRADDAGNEAARREADADQGNFFFAAVAEEERPREI